MSAAQHDRDAVQVSIPLGLPPERAWQHITDGQHLSQWFAEHAAMEPTAGGAFHFGGTFTPPDAPAQIASRVVLADKPAALQFTWPMHAQVTQVRFTLSPAEAGTQLALSHSGLAIPLARIGRMDLATQMECFWGNVLGNLSNVIAFGRPGLRLPYTAQIAQSGVVEESIDIGATPARIWQALTDPTELDQWIAVAAQVELRPGGAYSFGWGDAVGFPVAIIALDPPHQLVHSWDDAGHVERVTWTLTPLGDGTATRLTVRHEVRDPQNSEEYRVGWPGFLNRLWRRLASEDRDGGAAYDDHQPV